MSALASSDPGSVPSTVSGRVTRGIRGRLPIPGRLEGSDYPGRVATTEPRVS